MPDIMTPEEVADYLRVSTATVYRLIRGNQLAASRVGREYRIPRADLEAFLMAHSNRDEVRQGLFRRVLEIAERNPGLDSDDVLAELEGLDAERAHSVTGDQGLLDLRSHATTAIVSPRQFAELLEAQSRSG